MSGSRQKPAVGILGAGQLALMLAEAAGDLGIEVRCAGAVGDCAERVATLLPVDLEDREAVACFAQEVDRVTIESENIEAGLLVGLPVFPNAEAIRISQDRLLEKRFFEHCGLGTAPFAAVNGPEDFDAAIAAVGTPAILKTRRMGYDGKGQVRLARREELGRAWQEVGEVPCILEGLVPFECEVSLLGVRSRRGEVVFYPLACNVHREGILRKSTAPYLNAELQSEAEAHMRVLMERMEYVGVLAVEFFVDGGRLLANEMAPRVHNSGHWTIEGAETSQFANHLRAMIGMPLGSTASRPTVMLNCIGSMPPEVETAQFPELARHDYGKDARPGRKMGHLTFPAEAREAILFWEERLLIPEESKAAR